MSSRTRPSDAYLSRWQEAGLLDAETAARIRAFEEESPRGRDRPGVVEAGVYLGLAVIAVGVFVLISTNWEHLRPWARISVSAVPAFLALVVGQVMRVSATAGMRRGGTVAWLLALALVTTTAAIIADESGCSGENIALAAGVVALASSVALWVVMPSHAQLLGVEAAMFVFSVAVANRAEPGTAGMPAALGFSLALFGIAGVILAEFDVFVPRTLARVMSSLGVVAGGFFAGMPSGPGPAEALAFVGGAGLVAVSIRRGVFVYTGMGVASLFIGLVTLILRHVDNTTSAAVALIAVGAALLAAVLLLERLRPWARPRAEA